MLGDRTVEPVFLQTRTVLDPTRDYYDFTRYAPTTTVVGETYAVADVTADADKAKVGKMKAGDVIISSAEPFYIREVVSVTKTAGNAGFSARTRGIDPFDLVRKGSGYLKKTFTQEEVLEVSADASPSGPGGSPADSKVRLLPAEKPNQTRLKFRIGQTDPQRNDPDISGKVDLGMVLYDRDGNLKTKHDQVTAKGTFSVELGLESALDIGLFDVNYAKLVAVVKFVEDLNFEIGVSVKVPETGPESEKFKIPFAHPFPSEPTDGHTGPRSDSGLDIRRRGNVHSIQRRSRRQGFFGCHVHPGLQGRRRLQ